MIGEQQALPRKLRGLLLAIGFAAASPLYAAQQDTAKIGTEARWPRVEEGISLASDFPAREFHVFEDGVEQPGATIEKDSRPRSILVMVDVSKSMKPAFASILQGVRALVAAAQPDDEFAVVTFSWAAYVEQPFTTDRAKLSDVLSGLKFVGDRSALRDAADASIKQFGDARNKRGHVLFSDGLDRASHASEKKFIRTLEGLTAPSMYIVCPASHSDQGVNAAVRMSVASGGMTFTPDGPDLSPGAAKIAHLIDTLNRLEYSSTHTRADGKPHRIDVLPGSDASKTEIVFRQEYYASAQ